MHENKSPWLHQLNLTRQVKKIEKDEETETVIIGAGIAGVATAFFILKNTTKKLILLDAGRVAHGASGHNAGQLVSYFEKQFYSLVGTFGLKMAAEGQKAIDDSWELLDEMYTDAGLTIPVSRFVGFSGIVSYVHVLEAIENNQCRKEAGLKLEQLSISEEAPFLSKISPDFKNLYEVVPKSMILESLETEDDKYVAMLSSQKGVANSALLCNEIVDFLLKTYPERITLFEETPINKIILKKDSVLLDAEVHTIKANEAILCTNGFENFKIFSEDGLDVDTSFHEKVGGYIGYMSGYLEKMDKQPTALGYIDDLSVSIADKDLHYYYLTRRPFEYEKGVEHNLISVGGPGDFLEHKNTYDKKNPYPAETVKEIDDFVNKTYKISPNKTLDRVFTWHGLMGFTKNMVRLIGKDKRHPNLLYNLGCNGVGLLPSIYGGFKISKILAGENFSQSIFDPE